MLTVKAYRGMVRFVAVTLAYGVIVEIFDKQLVAQEHCRAAKAKGDKSATVGTSLYDVVAVLTAIEVVAKKKKDPYMKLGRKIINLAGVDPKKLKNDIEKFENDEVEKELIRDIEAEIYASLQKQKQEVRRQLKIGGGYEYTREDCAEDVKDFQTEDATPDDIKQFKKASLSMFQNKNNKLLKTLSSESFTNFAGFLTKTNLKVLAKDLKKIHTGEFLDPYRGVKSGKYASDGQMNHFESFDNKAEFRAYIDISTPREGVILSDADQEHQQTQYQKTGKWYYFFKEDGTVKNTDLCYEAFSFYRPTEPADIEHLIQLEIPYPENWFYPAASIVPETTFSKILEIIEARWVQLPKKAKKD